MKHNDERYLWNRFQNLARKHANGDAEFPHLRMIARELGIDAKRAAYLANKWTAEGLVDWGTSPLGCWITDRGLVAEIGVYEFDVDEEAVENHSYGEQPEDDGDYAVTLRERTQNETRP